MKPGLIFVFSILILSACERNNQTVQLKWKIDRNEELNYFTTMSEIDSSYFDMDFGGLNESLSGTTDEGIEESKDFFKKLNDLPQNQNLVTTLTNRRNGVIDIVMTSKAVVIRGSVYETGGVHSFWVKSTQKNLIALLFELPTKPLKIGDIWPLDINLIENDQNFTCDDAHKINEVTLIDIKIIDGETIAVLKYNIMEYVHGIFISLSSIDNESDVTETETMMKLTHHGLAEFSVDKGRWISYDAIMSMEMTGIMTVNQKTKLTLKEHNASK